MTATGVAAEYDRLITLRRQEVFSFAALPSIRAFASTTAETRAARAAVALNELQSWVASDTRVRQVSLVDANGVVTMTTAAGWNSNMHAREFVQEALAGELAVSPPARDRGEFSNYYAAPILNNRGDVVGALVARVAAQELWEVAQTGASWYTVLADENGVRLDDSGDAARRMTAFGPLDDARATRVATAQVYGAELLQVKSTNLARAQAALVSRGREVLRAGDFEAGELASAQLETKPWTVLVIAPSGAGTGWMRIAISAVVGVVLAMGAALALGRMARGARETKAGG